MVRLMMKLHSNTFVNKNKHIIAFIIIGIIMYLIGAWAKITHQSYGNMLITISHFTMIAGCVTLLIKVLLNNNDRFLNK